MCLIHLGSGVQLTSLHRKPKLIPRYQWHSLTLPSNHQQTNSISHLDVFDILAYFLDDDDDFMSYDEGSLGFTPVIVRRRVREGQ